MSASAARANGLGNDETSALNASEQVDQRKIGRRDA